jgi:uncharacterized membrane protein
MMFYKYQAIFPILAMVLVVSAIAFGVWLARALRLPQCCRCGAAKVRRSRVAGLVDRAALLLLLIPVRCSGCRARFYALRFPPRPINGRAGQKTEHLGVHLATR